MPQIYEVWGTLSKKTKQKYTSYIKAAEKSKKKENLLKAAGGGEKETQKYSVPKNAYTL